MTEQTWWGTEGDPIFEAPLSREDPGTVSMTQKGPPDTIGVFNATKVVHRHQEILFIVHLEWRGDVGHLCTFLIDMSSFNKTYLSMIYTMTRLNRKRKTIVKGKRMSMNTNK